jgi:hypothetical protein
MITYIPRILRHDHLDLFDGKFAVARLSTHESSPNSPRLRHVPDIDPARQHHCEDAPEEAVDPAKQENRAIEEASPHPREC